MNDYPTVRTDDILIHPRDGDVIVATHGRSIWIADDITPLEQLTPAVRPRTCTCSTCGPRSAYLFDFRTDADVGGEKNFVGENAPRGTAISYYLKSAATGRGHGLDRRAAGESCARRPARRPPGFIAFSGRSWRRHRAASGGGRGGGGVGGGAGGPPDPACSGGGGGGRGGNNVAQAPPGTYNVKLTVNGRDYTKPVVVLEDVWLHER